MIRHLKESDNYKNYTVRASFGFIGDETIYDDIYAKNEEDALEQARSTAEEELSVENIEMIDEDEYEVEVSFGGMIGVSNFYTVTANSEEEAEEEALQEAVWDIEVEIV